MPELIHTPRDRSVCPDALGDKQRQDKIRTSQVQKAQNEAMMEIIAEVKRKTKLSNPPSKAASLSRHRARVIPQAPKL